MFLTTSQTYQSHSMSVAIRGLSGELKAPSLRCRLTANLQPKFVILLTLPNNLRMRYCFGGFIGVRNDAVEEVVGLSVALMKCPMPVMASSMPLSPCFLDVSISKYAQPHSCAISFALSLWTLISASAFSLNAVGEKSSSSSISGPWTQSVYQQHTGLAAAPPTLHPKQWMR